MEVCDERISGSDCKRLWWNITEEVAVTEREEERTIVVELKWLLPIWGKVIGRQGRIAKAIRTVVNQLLQM